MSERPWRKGWIIRRGEPVLVDYRVAEDLPWYTVVRMGGEIYNISTREETFYDTERQAWEGILSRIHRAVRSQEQEIESAKKELRELEEERQKVVKRVMELAEGEANAEIR